MTEIPYKVLPLIDADLKTFLDVLPDLNDVVFVLVSNHGHTLVTTDETHRVTEKEIGKALKKQGYKAYIPAKKGEERNQEEEQKSLEKANGVIRVNDGMAHFYVKKSGSSKWSDTPDFCKDIIPRAHKLRYTQDKIPGKPKYIMKINGDESK